VEDNSVTRSALHFVPHFDVRQDMKNIIPAFFVALLTACEQGESRNTEIDRGTFSDGEYRNESLGFSLAFPDSWYIEQMGMEEFVQFDAALDEFMANYERENKIRKGEGAIYHGLFGVFLPHGSESTPAYLNAYLVELSRLRGVDGASGYLRHFQGRFPQMDAIQIGQISSGELGGRQFDAISINASGVRRMEYATLMNEYALVFSILYETDEQLEEARRVLHGIRFDRERL